MNKFKVLRIKRKDTKLKKFLKNIKEKNFFTNKSFKNTPWIHFKNKNFFFFKIEKNRQIISLVVIIKLYKNTHLQFFYVGKPYRSKGFGREILKKILPKKKFTTVHVPKKLSIRTEIFYKNNNFKLSNLNEENKLIKYWIRRCVKYDKKTFLEKKLLYRNLK